MNVNYTDKEQFDEYDPAKWNAQDANDVKNAINSKIDKIQGKGLSTEDFTTNLKRKLESLSSGGEGGSGIAFKVQSITAAAFTISYGSAVVIQFDWSSVDRSDFSETGSGSIVVTAAGKTVQSGLIKQGVGSVDITKYLISGANKVTLTITDSYGNTRTVNYDITVISLVIASSYSPATINDGDIIFRYTPTGSIEKTVHFVLDGVELASVVTSLSGRQQTITIPKQVHGTHSLRVYMTALVEGNEIRSNELYFDLLCIEPTGTATLIASTYKNVTIEQFKVLSIPFVVYSPTSNYSDVVLKVNGTPSITLNVDRNLQYWDYKVTGKESIVLSIQSGLATKNIEVTVTPSAIDVEAETTDLSLYLTSQNRSNNEQAKSEWKFNNISATLSGFDFASNGWLSDKFGSTGLKISNEARVTIPYKMFSTDFKNIGSTIEFDFMASDVSNDNSILINCMYGDIGFQVKPQTALFSSEQTEIETHFKENERIRITLVTTKSTESRLIQMYVNGVMSAVEQYPLADTFQQIVPQNITIGSSTCTTWIYNIRVYDNNLNQYQLLDNFIADLDDIDKKVIKYNGNQLYDDFGNLSYAKALNYLPCMIMEGALPAFKGDKKTFKIIYENLQEPSKSFTSTGASVDVQGTSSQYYPRKNYKIKFKNFIDLEGVSKPKYQMRGEKSVPEAVYTFKADFAESSGTHNTGISRIIHDSLKALNYNTPKMITDPRVRTTIDGFPILIFHRENADDDVTFLGKYNFNNDKADEDTFGFFDGAECWEVLNNTSDNILFKTADFTSVDANGKPLWQSDFEGRYPDGYTDLTKLKRIASWIVSCKNNPTKFKAEAKDYFNLNYLVFYYVITEIFAMVDQRGKNMMLSIFPDADGKDRCYPIFYDSDTTLGLNNEGAISFDYSVEYHDVEGTGNVWNAEQSVLWNLVEQTMLTEITDLYKRLRTEDIVSYEKVLIYLNNEQADKWSESIYNEDSRFKYIEPLTEGGNASYLYAAQGSREEHRKWWVYNRFRYMDSKYNTSTFLSDYITMRLYTPAVWSGVFPSADFQLEVHQKSYTKIKYGSYMVEARLEKDAVTSVKAPDIRFNDTETIIYGASLIKSLGSLASKYPGTLDASKAVNLTELIVGSDVNGYYNTNLIALTLGSNTLLRTLNIIGCRNLTQVIDLSRCLGIQEILASNSGISGVTLPSGGSLKTLSLPAVKSLIIKNQILLNDTGLKVSDYSNITTLVIENTPHLDIKTIIQKATAVNRLRLIGITATSENEDILLPALAMRGLDSADNTVNQSVIVGNWYFTKIFIDNYNDYRQKWPDLQITYGQLVDTITFLFNEALLVSKFDTNKNGKLSITEIRAIKDMAGVFAGVNGNNQTFDEFKFFTGVTEIGENDIPPDVKSVTLPSSVTKIKDNANLNPKGWKNYQQITYIGKRAFKIYSGGLADTPNLVFPNLTYIAADSFSGNKGIRTIDFTGSSFTEIFGGAFWGTEINDVIFPNSLVKLGSGVFTGSTNIRRIILPKSLKEIGNECFKKEFASVGQQPYYITSLKLNDGLETIGSDAFWGLLLDPSIELVIPSSVWYIGDRAFKFFEPAKKLNIIMGNVPPQIGPNTFDKANVNIYVPDVVVDVYKSATNWNQYASVIKPISTKPL